MIPSNLTIKQFEFSASLYVALRVGVLWLFSKNSPKYASSETIISCLFGCSLAKILITSTNWVNSLSDGVYPVGLFGKFNIKEILSSFIA